VDDARRILVLRGLRAFAYGFTSILLGVYLSDFLSLTRAGAIITATLAGSAAVTAWLGYRGDRIGRRRIHIGLSIAMAGATSVFALTRSFPALFAAALTGTMAAAVLEAGPFVAIEQAMLPHAVPDERRNRWFGRYTAVAAIIGSLGALAAGGPDVIRKAFHSAPSSQRWFLLPAGLAVVSAVVAAGLSPAVEAPAGEDRRPLRRSKMTVAKLSGLFALDGLGGGFVVTALIVYYFRTKFGASTEMLGLVFFGVGVLQSVSFLVAARLADRFGLINTMVFTHLPSNLLLAAIPFAPNQTVAIILLLSRFALSQMDVPARQSYVVAVVDPEERTAAAMFTNTSKATAQAVSPVVSGAVSAAGSGVPFIVGAGLKIVYDLLLYRSFRSVRTPEEEARA